MLSPAIIVTVLTANANNMTPPSGYVFLIDTTGAYMTDDSGVYLLITA